MTVSASVALLGVLARYMRRKRQTVDPKKYRRVAGKRSRASGIKSPNGGTIHTHEYFLNKIPNCMLYSVSIFIDDITSL